MAKRTLQEVRAKHRAEQHAADRHLAELDALMAAKYGARLAADIVTSATGTAISTATITGPSMPSAVAQRAHEMLRQPGAMKVEQRVVYDAQGRKGLDIDLKVSPEQFDEIVRMFRSMEWQPQPAKETSPVFGGPPVRLKSPIPGAERERGQASAVKAAPPVKRGVQVYCQGDYLDD